VRALYEVSMKIFKIELIVIIAFSIVFFSCGKKKMLKEAEEITAGLTLDQKIGQMVMVAIPGNKMNKRAERILRDYLPGGIVYFGFNLTSGHHIESFTAGLQKKSMRYSHIPMFVSIDQEGGRVKRIVDGVTLFPGNMAAGIAGDRDLVYRWGQIIGMQLRQLGINMNLAPVLDVNNNPANPVINTRSFGSNSDIVSSLGTAYIDGIQKSGCIAVGKHFPGHGDTNKDSHLTLPVINYDLKRLEKIEFPPFIEAIDEGVECIMTAHIAFPEILNSHDSATISKKFLTDILRKKMKFNGIIITDDMEMNAISKKMDMGEAAVRSVLAGADIVLVSSYGDNIGIIVNGLKNAFKEGVIPREKLNESVKRIIELKLRYGILDYSNGKITMGNAEVTSDDRKLLDQATRINEKISKEAIYFHGREDLLHARPGTGRIFISTNQLVKKNIGIRNNDIVLQSLDEINEKMLNSDAGREIVLYYHIARPNLSKLKRVKAYCEKNGLEPVIISSGNPFPIARSRLFSSMLFSFSNTDESLRQLCNSINGKLEPKRKINFFLGIKNK